MRFITGIPNPIRSLLAPGATEIPKTCSEVLPGVVVEVGHPGDCYIQKGDESSLGGKLITFRPRLYGFPKKWDRSSAVCELPKIYSCWTTHLKKIGAGAEVSWDAGTLLDHRAWRTVRTSPAYLRSLVVVEVIRTSRDAEATAARVHRFVESNPLPAPIAADMQRGIIWWLHEELHEVLQLADRFPSITERVEYFVNLLERDSLSFLRRLLGHDFRSSRDAIMTLLSREEEPPEVDIKSHPALFYLIHAARLLKA